MLALYTFTGGVPKYVELFCDNITLNIDEMISFMVRENSPFTDEGKNLLIEEFGKNYATYFSILSAISGGVNTQPEIETALGDKSIGGQIKRLIEDYNIIVRQRPILAKEGSQAVRYEIQDNFIRFWFNYFDRHRSLIEIKNFVGLQAIIKSDYPTIRASCWKDISNSSLLKVSSTEPLVHGGNLKVIRTKLICCSEIGEKSSSSSRSKATKEELQARVLGSKSRAS